MGNPLKLYIIGNGFDLHHEMPSRFTQFYEWLGSKDFIFAEELDTKYSVRDKEWWKDFENNLSQLSVSTVLSSHSNLFSTKEYNDFTYRHLYRIEDTIKDDLENDYVKLRGYFREWIVSLPAGKMSCKIDIDESDAVFLTFNYTDTLQKLYKIPDEKILHVHGKIQGEDTELIFGHGDNYDNIVSNSSDEDDDFPTIEAIEVICQHIYDLRKPVEEIININKEFFLDLIKINTIYVYGFSFSNIDKPYIREIVNHIDILNVDWVISYHSDIDKEKAQEMLESLKIPSSKYKFIVLKEMQHKWMKELPFKD
ncbi:bacteriophage abortive infection AbiH family protein [Gabonibacter chumensis]|uniref:bacteriophage abortive infection AbiH family protein n=1 Tax=Gabonibacter chumensis TaxID=2972474 RepID=UPI0025732164|nr:bacteriophage abortive infection AbiH family protein [Gabonibacter chumensis]MCR9011976.1 bacteriophage abortive infection AbiH family protein [Gabonibacter chumensis]